MRLVLAAAAAAFWCVAAGAFADPAPPDAVISGFRTAHFGMDQAAVEAAIAADFHLPASAIKTGLNPVQQTGDIAITVPALAPGAGKARIDYVFGYKSRRLVEINIAWATAVDPANTAPTLLAAAQQLQAYFTTRETFPPGKAATNLVMADGTILAFRGMDSNGHAVLVALSGPASKPDANKHVTMVPALLSMVYASDPAHPDVFQLPNGAF
jgi:hypothetical protein